MSELKPCSFFLGNIENVTWRVDNGIIYEPSSFVVDGIKYVEERTCHLIEQWTDKGTAFGTDEFLGYKCSYCGYNLIDKYDKYCSECGAKVV